MATAQNHVHFLCANGSAQRSVDNILPKPIIILVKAPPYVLWSLRTPVSRPPLLLHGYWCGMLLRALSSRVPENGNRSHHYTIPLFIENACMTPGIRPLCPVSRECSSRRDTTAGTEHCTNGQRSLTKLQCLYFSSDRTHAGFQASSLP